MVTSRSPKAGQLWGGSFRAPWWTLGPGSFHLSALLGPPDSHKAVGASHSDTRMSIGRGELVSSCESLGIKGISQHPSGSPLLKPHWPGGDHLPVHRPVISREVNQSGGLSIADGRADWCHPFGNRLVRVF